MTDVEAKRVAASVGVSGVLVGRLAQFAAPQGYASAAAASQADGCGAGDR
jgi:hypothetical protein